MCEFLALRGHKAWAASLIVILILTACSAGPATSLTQTSISSSPPAQSGTVVPATAIPTVVPAQSSGTPPAVKSSQPALAAAPQIPATGETAATSVPNPNAGPQWKEITSGLNKPTSLSEFPDGSSRLAVLEQRGKIRVITKVGALQPQVYLDLTDRVGSRGSEQGLLGLAFHPKFTSNGFFYVFYTDVNGDDVIIRFHAAVGAPAADANSEKLILKIKEPFPNHNGGQLAFGPDGFLYIGVGDGGSANDPQKNGQSLNTLLAKILRIDVDNSDPYAIPASNPYAKGGGLPEIYAYGLRNPWRFSFDQANGDLYIGDVGQNMYEEIDYIPAGSPAGQNFGWNLKEGSHPFQGIIPAGAQLVDPVWEYDHSQGCAVIGGYVYHGKQLPGLAGTYFYGDDCSGLVWSLKRDASGKWQNQLLYQTKLNISSFGQDLSGELYLIDLTGGRVMRLSN